MGDSPKRWGSRRLDTGARWPGDVRRKALHNALDRRLGLTPAERLHYEEVYGQAWLMVKDMLGHRSEQVTRDVYLEPVRGLQLESLLGDDDNRWTRRRSLSWGRART
ncbi:hypothetical protein AABB02_05490 [Streptomyces rimosus]|uniref:hypothetical protein n=1 Tax=Streptomyces rimosus TaxID=1927 RepID=UPI0031E34A07